MLGQNLPNSSTHFLKHKSVSPQILHYSLVSWHNSSAIFGLKHNRLRQKKHIKVQIFRFATDRIKTHQIAYVIFGTMSQLFFKLCITLQWPETWYFCTFSSETWYAFTNFASLFSVMIQFLWNFRAKKLYALDKTAHQGTIFKTFKCPDETSPNSSCHF